MRKTPTPPPETQLQQRKNHKLRRNLNKAPTKTQQKKTKPKKKTLPRKINPKRKKTNAARDALSFHSISHLFCENFPSHIDGAKENFPHLEFPFDDLLAKPAASAKTANRSIEEKSPPTNHEKIPPNSSKISKCAPAKQTAPKPALACPSHPRKPRRRLDDQTASKAFFFPQRQGGKDYEFSRPARRNKKPKQFSSQRQGAPKPKNSQSRQTTPKPALTRPFLSEFHAPLGRPNHLQSFLFFATARRPQTKNSQNRQTPPKAALARPSHPRKPMRRFLDGQPDSKDLSFSRQRQGGRL